MHDFFARTVRPYHRSVLPHLWYVKFLYDPPRIRKWQNQFIRFSPAYKTIESISDGNVCGDIKRLCEELPQKIDVLPINLILPLRIALTNDSDSYLSTSTRDTWNTRQARSCQRLRCLLNHPWQGSLIYAIRSKCTSSLNHLSSLFSFHMYMDSNSIDTPRSRAPIYILEAGRIHRVRSVQLIGMKSKYFALPMRTLYISRMPNGLSPSHRD